MRRSFFSPARFRRGFTIVELMIASCVLGIILILIFSIIQQTSEAWKNSAAKIESFQGARAAFEAMTQRISQATLSTYYDYYDALGRSRKEAPTNFAPDKYGRFSDLQFVSGKTLVPSQITHSIFFQAPMGFSDSSFAKGLGSTLNGCGFFLEYGTDSSRPAFLAGLTPAPPILYRYRLMEYAQPAEKLTIYSDPANQPLKWFTAPLGLAPDAGRSAREVAQNIVALIIRPKRTDADALKIADATQRELSADYEYNSRRPLVPIVPQPVTENQLPPLVEIVMFAVDEPSFLRFGNPATPPAELTAAQTQLFQSISNDDDLENDIEEFQKVLLAKPGNLSTNQKPMKFQIFRTEVPIRAAKWSE